MLTRAITGAVYVGVIITSVMIGGLILQGVMGVLLLFMIMEFYSMFKDTKASPNFVIGPVIALMLYGLFCYIFNNPNVFMIGPYLLAIIIVTILAFPALALAELFRKKDHPIMNIGVTLAGVFYITFPLTLIIATSAISEETNHGGTFPLLAIFVMIWCSDTFAYLVGRKFGKTKLAESISPNKTWEGFIGGVLFSLIAGAVIAYFIEDQPYINYIMLGLIAAVFGTLGDLVESKIKRSLNLKDSGNILPGHGGLLDRLDSILIAVPFAFLYMLAFIFS